MKSNKIQIEVKIEERILNYLNLLTAKQNHNNIFRMSLYTLMFIKKTYKNLILFYKINNKIIISKNKSNSTPSSFLKTEKISKIKKK